MLSGLAFTLEERKALKIEGLLPPYVIDQSIQVERVLDQFRRLTTPLAKYQFLVALSGRNEKLFYRTICENVAEMLPIVYTPTVGEACLSFGHVRNTHTQRQHMHEGGMHYHRLGAVSQTLTPISFLLLLVVSDL